MSVGLEQTNAEPSQRSPVIEIDVKGWGVVEFPAGTPPDEMKRALDDYFHPGKREEEAKGLMRQPAPPGEPEEQGWLERGARSALRSYRDTGVVMAKGLVGVPQAITGLADMMPITSAIPGGWALPPLAEKAGIPLYGWSGWMQEKLGIDYDEAQEVLHKAYSPEVQAAYHNVSEAKGLLGKTQAALQNPSMIATTIGESIPLMAVGGLIGKGIKGAGLLGKFAKHQFLPGAIGEGVISAGSGAEQTRGTSDSGFLTDKQVALHAASGALTTVVGILGGKAAAKLGLNDVDTLLGGGASQKAQRNVIVRVLGGAISEATEESAQSVQEQIASNLAQGKPWHEGWDQALVMGALSGAAMGGGINLARGGQPGLTRERFEGIKANDAAGKSPTVDEAKALGMSPAQSTNRKTRRAAFQQMKPALQEQFDAQTVRGPEGTVRSEEGRADFRGVGEEQVGTQPPGEVATAPPKAVRESADRAEAAGVEGAGSAVPQVVYHGTTAEFGEIGEIKPGDIGIHFGTADQANARLSRDLGGVEELSRAGARVIPVHLAIKNPLRLTDSHAWDVPSSLKAKLVREKILTPAEAQKIQFTPGDLKGGMEQIRGALIEKGYDGIVYLNRHEAAGASSTERLKLGSATDSEFKQRFPDAEDSYIAFDQSQVKSAIGAAPAGVERVKQPWEMTLEEWEAARHEASKSELRELKRKRMGSLTPVPDVSKTRERLRLEYGVEAAPIRKGGVPVVNHEAVVRKAISEGKPVPPEVLAEYGLSPQTPQTAVAVGEEQQALDDVAEMFAGVEGDIDLVGPELEPPPDYSSMPYQEMLAEVRKLKQENPEAFKDYPAKKKGADLQAMLEKHARETTATAPAEAPPGPPPLPPAAPGVPGGPGTRSTQNAYTETQRAAHGMNPRAPVVRHEWVVAHAKAMAKTDAQVDAEINALRQNPVAEDDVQEFTVLRRMNEIENRHEAAMARGDTAGAVAAEAELLDIYDIAERVGTAEGRALNARKAWIRDDDSLLGSIRRAVKKNNAPLTDAERNELVEAAKTIAAQKEELARQEEENRKVVLEKQHAESVAKTTAKVQATLRRNLEELGRTAGDYGVNYDNLKAEAKRRAAEEGESARDFNAAYRAAVDATGLDRRTIEAIENGRLFKDGKPVTLAEYGGLDTKAPMLAREYPELFETAIEPADVLVEILKRGRKHVPAWWEKLDEAAASLAREHGRELPEGTTFQGFPWEQEETGDFPPSEVEPEVQPKQPKPLTARQKAQQAKAKATEKRVARVAELKDAYAAFKQLGFAFDPQREADKIRRFLATLRDAAISYVEEGVRSFNAAVVRLASELGDMNPLVRKHFQQEWTGIVDQGMVPSPVIDPSDSYELGRFAKILHRWVVESGVMDLDEAIHEVHAELETIRPGITLSETMDAMSGYGEFKELSKDKVSVKIREHRGEIQQIRKIEDLNEAIAEARRLKTEGKSEAEIADAVKELLPKKTGVEKRTPSTAESRLIAEVNRLKKEIPVSVEAGSRQLKTSQDAVKTYLGNLIDEYVDVLAAGEELARKKQKPLVTDPEIIQLRAILAELKTYYDSIHPKEKKTRTPKQRAEATDKALGRAIEVLEADLGRGHVGRPGKPLTSTSTKIEAKRAKLKRLRELRDNMRELDPEFQKDEDARLLAARKQLLEKKLADLNDRWERQDFAKKPIRRSPEDEKTLELRHQVSEARKRQRAKEEEIARANRPMREKVAAVPVEVARAMKSLWSSGELSYVLRQGGHLAASHPILAVKAQKRSFRAAISDKEAFAIQEEIAARPHAKSGLYDRAKLELLDISGPLVSRAEEYQSTYAQQIPLLGHIVKGSERAFIAQGNQQKADVFDAMIETMCRDPGNVTDAEAQAIANYVNVASWRGNVAGYEQAAAELGAVLWTPRGYVSRFQYLIGQPYFWPMYKGRLSKRAARAIRREYTRTLIGTSIFYGTSALALYAAFGPPGDNEREYKWNLSFNPYSADFGKIRLGHSRIDPLSGLSQVTRLTTRLSTNTLNGLYQLMGGRLTKQAREDMKATPRIEGQFLRNKFAPAMSLVTEVQTGEDYDRERLTAGGLALKMVTPMAYEDIYKSMKEHGVPEGVALSVLIAFGMGVEYYEPKK